jgi:hypothetical protein
MTSSILARLTNIIIGKRQSISTQHDKTTYRAFREQIINAMDMNTFSYSSWAHRNSAGEVLSSNGRMCIKAYRKFIVENRLNNPSLPFAELKHIKLALGLPPRFPVRAHWLKSIGFVLLGLTLTEKTKLLVMVTVFRATRTEEGRNYLYKRFLKHLAFTSDSEIDQEALNLVLLRVNGLQTFEHLFSLSEIPVDILKAAFKLGKRDATWLIEALTPLKFKINPRLIHILVEEGVIENDFACLIPYLKKRDWNNFSLRNESEGELRLTIQILKVAGVPPNRLLCLLDVDFFNSEHLNTILFIFKRHGVTDITTVFSHLKQHLWRVEFDALQYVLVILQIRDARLFGRFRDLLMEYRAPKPNVAIALLARGATASELASCQNFLIKSGQMFEPAIERLDILMCSPYSLGFHELNGCDVFLNSADSENTRFDEFLKALAQYTLDNKDTLLMLCPHYNHIATGDGLKLRLEIVRRNLPSFELVDIISWIRKSQSKRDRSLRYLGLENGITFTDLSTFNKLAELSDVCPSLLKYLVNVRGLHTIGQIYGWYKKEGGGVAAYYGGENYDSADLLLFEDCTRRASFYRLYDNADTLTRAVSDFVNTRLPAIMRDCPQAEREAYWLERNRLIANTRVASMPFLEPILARTEGVLLGSVLIEGLCGGSFEVALQKLGPLTNSLIVGGGPLEIECSSFSVECISLVYGASQTCIREHWRRVSGFETHISHLQLEASYPITLKLQAATYDGMRDTVRAAMSKTIDCLAEAVLCVQIQQSPFDLLTDLSWKHASNKAATLNEIWPWFAFLLKLGAASEDVKKWINVKLGTMHSLLAETGAASVVEREFSQFVRATLPDVLKVELPAFLSGAEFVSRRDELKVIINKQRIVESELPVAISTMVTFTLSIVTRLSAQFTRLLKTSSIENRFSGHAVVSKHPTAFFAKDAFELCSKNDTAMWEERRHSHLLIFDPKHNRLVGMAMLYIQPIPGFAKNKQCLVIRAINMRAWGHMTFEPVSVLDEIMRISVAIAHANNLAAILYPLDATHFSNQNDILKACSKSTMGKSTKCWSSSGEVFYCRELGKNSDAVRKLHVAWTADNEAVSS